MPEEPTMMKIEEAMEIVYDLAMENSLSMEDCDGDESLIEECNRQAQALAVVHDFVINNIAS